MTYPEPVVQLLDYIKTTHQTQKQTVMIAVEGPTVGGYWLIDLTDVTSTDDKHVNIEWSPQTGFGLSNLTGQTGIEGYGLRPDEHFDTLKDVQRRITELLATG